MIRPPRTPEELGKWTIGQLADFLAFHEGLLYRDDMNWTTEERDDRVAWLAVGIGFLTDLLASVWAETELADLPVTTEGVNAYE